jgi:hypothetical protein
MQKRHFNLILFHFDTWTVSYNFYIQVWSSFTSENTIWYKANKTYSMRCGNLDSTLKSRISGFNYPIESILFVCKSWKQSKQFDV